MSEKEQKNKIFNFISKLNIINNNKNHIHKIVSKKNTNAKIININKIFSKCIKPKKYDDYVFNKNIKHKKIISNIEDYNNLVKLNLTNRLKKTDNKKNENPIIHRRMLTEKKIYDINNKKNKTGNHFVLINNRNIKNNNNDQRLITDYFIIENKEKSKKTIERKINQNTIHNNNSLSIDFHNFHQASTERKTKLKDKDNNIKETPSNKRYIKYLKKINLCNHSHSQDKTYTSNIKKRKKESHINNLESFEISDTNMTSTNYCYSFDGKSQALFNKNKKKNLTKTFFNHAKKKLLYSNTNNNIITEKILHKKSSNFKLKKYFLSTINNNLTIDNILQTSNNTSRPKIKIKNRNNININNSKEYFLTTINSFKKIKNIRISNDINNKIKLRKNLWNLNINLNKNSKIKIAKIMKQKKLTKKTIKNIFTLTKKGFWQPGINKPNQDNYFIFKNFLDNIDNYYIGVCDGHGKHGKEVSTFIVNNLPNNLNKNINNSSQEVGNSLSNMSKIIIYTFDQLNTLLISNPNINTLTSGSTCSSLILTPNSFISINLGDSRAILAKYNQNNNNYIARNLTTDHKPFCEDEQKRIIEKGGIISQARDEFGNKRGILRIWKNEEDSIGLALTRCFGDQILSQVGISCEPEIKEFFFEENDKFIIIATDGLWEYISSQECVDMVKNFYEKDELQNAVNFLYKEAAKRWIMEQDIVDDITIILIALE